MTGEGDMYEKTDTPKAGAVQYVMIERDELKYLIEEVKHLRHEMKEVKKAVLENQH